MACWPELGFNRNSFWRKTSTLPCNRPSTASSHYHGGRGRAASRANGFESINADLIMACPTNAGELWAHAGPSDRGLPDRIALYNYAHLPARFKAQRLINESDLPSAELRLQIFLMSMRRLLDAGYVGHIGWTTSPSPTTRLNWRA